MNLWIKNKFALPILGVTLGIFLWPILMGRIPLPGDALVGLYHPYRDFFSQEYPNGIPYKNFLITDPVRQQYIWKKFAIAQLTQGQVPHWNPYTHSGMPLMANMQAGVFYPVNFIFWLFSFADAWTLFIILQSSLGSLFMYAYLKNQKLHPTACILGTLSFIFSGFFVVWWEWGNIGHTILWLPASLWSIDKYVESRKNKFLIFHSSFLTLAFFAGHLQTWFYLALVVFFYSLWKKLSFKLVIGIWLLVVIVTAIQWLPTLQLIKLSARDIDQSQILTRPDWFIPWQNLAQLIAPDFFGNPATLNYWGVWNYAEFVGYIGLIPLIFALSTIKNKTVRFWWIIVITGLVFALPTPIAKIPFVFRIPFLSQAQPSRLLSIISFSLAVLSAYGFHRFKSLKYPSLMTGLSLFSLWVIAIKFNLPVSQRNLILPTVVFIIFITIILVSRRKFLLPIACWLLLLVSTVDILRFAKKFTPFSPREYIFPETAAIEFLKSDPDVFRIMSLDRRILPPNIAMYYGLQTIEGYDPLYLKSYAKLVTRMETGAVQAESASFNRIISPTNLNSDILNKLNVKYILSLNPVDNPNLKLVFKEGETKVYENTRVLNRARLLTGTDPVIIKSYAPDQVILEVDTSVPNVLELADMMYPGWKATVDDQPVDIIASPENFRQVAVPAGRHQIIFQI